MLLEFTEIPVLNANSVDPDQTLRSAESDLGLHYLCPFYGTLGVNGLKGKPLMESILTHWNEFAPFFSLTY